VNQKTIGRPRFCTLLAICSYGRHCVVGSAIETAHRIYLVDGGAHEKVGLVHTIVCIVGVLACDQTLSYVVEIYSSHATIIMVLSAVLPHLA